MMNEIIILLLRLMVIIATLVAFPFYLGFLRFYWLTITLSPVFLCSSKSEFFLFFYFYKLIFIFYTIFFLFFLACIELFLLVVLIDIGIVY